MSEEDKNFYINLVKKTPHKIYRADIQSDDDIKSLCKFLRKQKDRELEIILNGKSFKFDSIIGRKRWVSGFEQAFTIIEPYMADFVEGLEKKLNQSLSDRDVARKEAKKNHKKYIDIANNYSTKHAVIDLRIAAWKDQIAEWEDNCKYLQEQVSTLCKKLEKTNGQSKRHRRSTSGRDS